LTGDDLPRIPHSQRSEWFAERYEQAASQILGFLASGSFPLPGKRVADVGCGDGIIDLAIARRAQPEILSGFDVERVDTGLLSRLSAEEGFGPDLPPNLRFAVNRPEELPAPEESFDVVFSWSAFQYLQSPQAMLGEIRRVLKPGGVLMIQLYPFFHSAHGSLLEPWFPEGWAHFLHSDEEIEARVRAAPGPDAGWAARVLRMRRSLNRITVDGLHQALDRAGFRVLRVELIPEPASVPPEVSHLPLGQLGTGGVKLLARPV
jgi:SAM-dependent methyltransferase